MSQFKHLSERFAQSTAGSTEERVAGERLLRWVLTGVSVLNQDSGCLIDELLKVKNQRANSGSDQCDCGCKYWENDLCISCGTQHARRHKHVEEEEDIFARLDARRREGI